MPSESVRLLGLCLLPGVSGKQWNVIARQSMRRDGVLSLESGLVDENHSAAKKLRENLEAQTEYARALERAEEVLGAASEAGSHFVTPLDAGFPSHLRSIRDCPPFLFVQGDMTALARPAVAVVGTRRASERVQSRARRIAKELVEHRFVVVSGMAAGVDGAAHEATLEAGGTTVAVMGTGITRCYPKEHVDLKARIEASGAVVSQFLPDQPPGRHTFPIRNAVTSGLSAATVVVEAAETSGARLQARIAAGQGRPVLLMKSLLDQHPWAVKMVSDGAAEVLETVDDVLRCISNGGPPGRAQPTLL